MSKKIDKFSWVDDLEIDELRTALREALQENESLRQYFLIGNTKNSVVLIKNTKGVNVEVKSYNENLDDATTDAVNIFDELIAKYKED